MKKATAIIAAATVALTASTAVAGNYGVPQEEDEVIVVPAEPGSSVGSLPLALAGLVIVGIAIAASGGSDSNNN